MYRWEENTLPKLRRLYNQSKLYVLLSRTEGVNRAAKEALLCNVPVLVIKGSTTAAEFVNVATGEAVADNQRAISETILEMLAHRERYSPRQWTISHFPRSRICEAVWNEINDLQRFPGYPDIHEANRIRRLTAREHDNYLDLNNWKGVSSRGSLAEEMRAIREAPHPCIR